ncbi:helix-turn-helix domain-containing protein [Nocardioides soli]|uniref:helix-turn-helix domain-containing protein n=1 Tax=Nocardioides soli TaxID=1036020 RepID=UPI00160A3B4D
MDFGGLPNAPGYRRFGASIARGQERYLSLLERQRIAALRRHGLSIREIARRLGRASVNGQVAVPAGGQLKVPTLR